MWARVQVTAATVLRPRFVLRFSFVRLGVFRVSRILTYPKLLRVCRFASGVENRIAVNCLMWLTARDAYAQTS